MECKLIRFPYEGIKTDNIQENIRPSKKSSRTKGGYFLGYPHTTPTRVALEAYKNYLEYNSNHVGTITRFHDSLTNSRKLENEVILMMGDLYGDSNIDGYINSGSTEGNILGIWIAKNYLNVENLEEVALLTSELAHHSVDKATSLISIKNVLKIPIDEQFSIDVDKLKSKIFNLITQGITKFILILTSGYTSTGTSDDFNKIEEAILYLQSKYTIDLYVHVDAAIGGFIYPFISEKGKYFEYNYVKSVTVDPHKMGFVPLSAGMFLCRKGLQDLIETPINYVDDKKDDTLIGSRNGASAVAIWATLNSFGFKGYKEILSQLIEMKNYLLSKLLEEKNVIVISNPVGNMLCISFNNLPDGKLPRYLEEKYTLDQFSIKYSNNKFNCYKIYFMPHLTIEVIQEFVYDIRNIVREGD